MYIQHWSKNDNRFEIKINIDYNGREDFIDAVNFLKQYYISFDDDKKVFYFQSKRADEIYLWMTRHKKDIFYDDSCIKKFEDIQNSFSPELEIYRPTLDLSILNPEYTPFNFQLQGSRFFLGQNRAYLTDSPGLGKTFQAILTFSILYKQGKIDSIFIIVRSGISYNWKKEILKFSTIFKEEDIEIIDNKNKRDVFENSVDKKIIIVSNHLFKDVILNYKKGYKFGRSAKRLRWKEYVDIRKLWQKENPLLIVDEAHEFTNSKAVKVRALESHVHHFKFRYFLSATPALSNFGKWWMSMKLLDRDSIGMSENAFQIDISKEIGDRFGMYNIKEFNTEKIENFKNKVLNKYVLKRDKSQLEEMKYKQIVKPIYLKMNSLQKKIYEFFTQDVIFRIEQEHDSVSLKYILEKYAYFMQVVDNPFLLEGKISDEKFNKLLGKWKLEKDARVEYLDNALVEYIENQEDKIVLFDGHPLSINMLGKRYEKYNPILIHGELGDSEKIRNEKEEAFNNIKSKHKLIIVNPSMVVGLNFNEGSNKIIFYTNPNGALLQEQAMERVSRINNTRNSLVIHLILDDTFDVLRHKSNTGEIKFNNKFLNKNLKRQELKNLLTGIV